MHACEPLSEEDGSYLVKGPWGGGPEPLSGCRRRQGGLDPNLGLGATEEDWLAMVHEVRKCSEVAGPVRG